MQKKLAIALRQPAEQPVVTVDMRDGELRVRSVPKGVVLLVKNYDERDPQMLDGGDAYGRYSADYYEGPYED